MFIYILAVIIILLGIFFLLTSIEVVPGGKKKFNRPGKSKNVKNINSIESDNDSNSNVDDAEFVIPENISNNEENIPDENYSIINEDSDDKNISPENENQGTNISNNPEKQENIRDCYQVVMFEDKDNIIDDSINNMDAESSYQKFSKLKRIGKGELIFFNDAFEFHYEKKMYRYDFKNIEYIYKFKNNLVLKLNKFNTKNVFLLDSNKDKIVEFFKKCPFYKES